MKLKNVDTEYSIYCEKIASDNVFGKDLLNLKSEDDLIKYGIKKARNKRLIWKEIEKLVQNNDKSSPDNDKKVCIYL